MRVFKVLCLLSLFMILDITCALYFYVAETERKCFIEEIPQDTTVIVNYKIELIDPKTGGVLTSKPKIGVHVQVVDGNLDIVMSREYTLEGKISFTSSLPGEHAICLYSTNSTSWFGGSQLRVHLDIQVGENAIDYAILAQKDKLSNIQLRIQRLLDYAHHSTKELKYARLREEKFRNTSDNTNQSVLKWSIAQICLLLVVGYWQMKNLRNFFVSKKLL